ncbi:hypothetical protein ACT3CE_00320 [Marinifilum sp. RC60d5]|uniref:hypothetical protein n=1 Tax=Marinifilum sp. RC60d5 TaxID=3458414 RepID=UPI0040360927
MINNQSFEALKAELSRAVFALKKQANGSNLEVIECPSFTSFKSKLISLQLEFNTEIHNNLRKISSQKDVELYFEMLLTSLAILKALICSSEVESIIYSKKEEYNLSNDISYIHYNQAQINQHKDYVYLKKDIIDQCISIAKSCKQKMKENITEAKNKDNACMHVMAEFAPYLSKYREALSDIDSQEEKIKFLKRKRQEITPLFRGKSIDLYSSPINVWFEASIEASRRSILQKKKKRKKDKRQGLRWCLSRAEFLELIMSLDLTKAIGDEKSTPVSKKVLVSEFSKFLGVKKIPDYESRMTKLCKRANPTAFLDRLRDKVQFISNRKNNY